MGSHPMFQIQGGKHLSEPKKMQRRKRLLGRCSLYRRRTMHMQWRKERHNHSSWLHREWRGASAFSPHATQLFDEQQVYFPRHSFSYPLQHCVTATPCQFQVIDPQLVADCLPECDTLTRNSLMQLTDKIAFSCDYSSFQSILNCGNCVLALCEFENRFNPETKSCIANYYNEIWPCYRKHFSEWVNSLSRTILHDSATISTWRFTSLINAQLLQIGYARVQCSSNAGQIVQISVCFLSRIWFASVKFQIASQMLFISC